MLMLNFMLVIFVVVTVMIFLPCNGYGYELAQAKSSFDDQWFRPVFRTIRKYLFNIVGTTSTHNKGKFLQESFSDNEIFLCDLKFARSEKIPDSVHKLRPGDIDVIAALGDSVTAGSGASATNLLHIAMENRGLSWSIGGQWNWRNSTTLANILKEFNPKLVGYSLNDSLPFERGAQFNLAEIGAVASDLPYMVKILVQRIKADSRVDFKNHWKMVTSLIGGNDFCSFICTWKNPKKYPRKYKEKLIQTLDYLKDNMPRTFVNIVSLPPLERVVMTKDRPEHCKTLHIGACSCWLGKLYNQTKIKRNLYRYIQKETWKVEKEVAMKYRGLKEFAVVHQPFTLNAMNYDENGKVDFSLWSFDCFHPSQKGQAFTGTSLWNNLLEPCGNKTLILTSPKKKFLCPTKNHPYIFTYDNSECFNQQCTN